jgi:hypothetical protein
MTVRELESLLRNYPPNREVEVVDLGGWGCGVQIHDVVMEAKVYIRIDMIST